METHFDLSDNDFEQHFATCKLSPVLFSHEAHLRLAWIHIDKYGISKAIANTCTQLKQFVVSIGAEDKYNETVTIAAIKAVYHFKLKSETTNFHDFILRNPKLKNNFKELLSHHYTTDIFNSKEARNRFIQPDLLPFD